MPSKLRPSPESRDSPRILARQRTIWKKGGMCQRSRDAGAVSPDPCESKFSVLATHEWFLRPCGNFMSVCSCVVFGASGVGANASSNPSTRAGWPYEPTQNLHWNDSVAGIVEPHYA